MAILQREPGTEQPLPGIHGHHPSWNALCPAAGLCHRRGQLLQGTHGSLSLQVPRPRLAPERRWPPVAPPRHRRPDPRPGPSCPPANPPSAMWYVGRGCARGWAGIPVRNGTAEPAVPGVGWAPLGSVNSPWEGLCHRCSAGLVMPATEWVEVGMCPGKGLGAGRAVPAPPGAQGCPVCRPRLLQVSVRVWGLMLRV